MTGQQSFTLDGPTRKARGVARVESNSDPEWVKAVDAIIVELADTGHPVDSEAVAFTIEAVRYIAEMRGLGQPHHPSAWSSRFAAAAKRGIITKTGRYVQSSRPERHSAVIAEWVGSWVA